ncbi:MAG: BCCT family transporter [Firmicutes bacterium]|nr:BCCT family transporter [Bacillota bacterium]
MKSENKIQEKTGALAGLDKPLFFIPLALVLGLSALIFIFPEGSNNAINAVFTFVTEGMGWTMQIFYFICIFLTGYLIFGKIGKKRFGAEKPEFSRPVWFGLIFTGGTSATIVYWGAIDWFMRFEAPPFGMQAMSNDAFLTATASTLFDWGPIALSIYAIVGVVFGYLFFVKREDTNRPSVAAQSVLKKHTNRALGKTVDIIYMFGILGGVAASVGLSTPLLAELLHTFFGWDNGLILNAGIVAVWTVFFIVGVMGGLKNTIAKMSNWRMWLIIIGMLIVFVCSDMKFVVHTFVDSFGVYLQNYMKFSFYSDVLGTDGGYPYAWTVFFYAWWLAYALSTGIYLARISRGRTVREFMLAGVGITAACIWAHHVFLGYYTAEVHFSGAVDVAGIAAAEGYYAAIVAVWQSLPGFVGPLVLVIMTLLTFISGVTIINGTAYTLAIVSSKKLSANEEPGKMNRILWAFSLGALGLALMFLGGLKPVQTACVATGMLTMIIIILVLYAFFKNEAKQWNSLMQKQYKEKGEAIPKIYLDDDADDAPCNAEDLVVEAKAAE